MKGELIRSHAEEKMRNATGEAVSQQVIESVDALIVQLSQTMKEDVLTRNVPAEKMTALAELIIARACLT